MKVIPFRDNPFRWIETAPNHPHGVEVSEEDLAQIGVVTKFWNKSIIAMTEEEIAAQEKIRFNLCRIPELIKMLTAYTQDFAQAQAGVYIPDIEERKAKFREVHAELRQLEGKAPRG